MEKNDKLVVFQDKKIRRIWHDNEWYFSVIDVVQVLTNSNNARNYWSMLKKRESEAGIELSTNCVQLKLISSDTKSRHLGLIGTILITLLGWGVGTAVVGFGIWCYPKD